MSHSDLSVNFTCGKKIYKSLLHSACHVPFFTGTHSALPHSSHDYHHRVTQVDTFQSNTSVVTHFS